MQTVNKSYTSYRFWNEILTSPELYELQSFVYIHVYLLNDNKIIHEYLVSIFNLLFEVSQVF